MMAQEQVFDQMRENRSHARRELRSANANHTNMRRAVEQMMSATAGTEDPKDMLNLYEGSVRRLTRARQAVL